MTQVASGIHLLTDFGNVLFSLNRSPKVVQLLEKLPGNLLHFDKTIH